jgi:hypothetical protein
MTKTAPAGLAGSDSGQPCEIESLSIGERYPPRCFIGLNVPSDVPHDAVPPVTEAQPLQSRTVKRAYELLLPTNRRTLTHLQNQFD